MPTKLLHNDASLISGQDHATNWKKQPESAFYESDTSFSQTSGTFSNGGITSVDFYNNTPNAVLVESHLHINVSNNDASNAISLESVAALIAKMTVYVNNIEIFKVNSTNNVVMIKKLQLLKEAENFTDYIELHNAMTGRIEASTTIYSSLAASTSGTVIVDMNALMGDMLSGLDNRAGKIRIELQWRTDSSAQAVSEFAQASANANVYSTLTWTNCFMRNKYEIINPKYILKEPIWKPLFQVEKQLVDITTGTEKILKLDDIFSNRKKAIAVCIVQRKVISDYSDADAKKTTLPYTLSYKIYQNGREVKNRSEPQAAQNSIRNWLKSINAARMTLSDTFAQFNPWVTGVVPLSNLFIEDSDKEKYLRGSAYTSPAMNYEIHLTMQNPTSQASGYFLTQCELYLLYSELAEFSKDGKVRVYT